MTSRSVSIPGDPGEPSLEGEWRGESVTVAVVAPPHPLMGGHLSNPVVEAIAEGLRDAGLATLAFNWRGVGESGGEGSGAPADADADLRAALVHAAETATVMVVSGYSFGGAAALRVGATRPELRVVAVAPPPALVPPGTLEALGARALVIAAELDTISPARDLSRLAAPPGASLVTIPGADHFFGAGTRRVVDAVAAWARVAKGGAVRPGT